MRTIGTVVRGIRAPIIREGDNIAQVTADAVKAAWEEAGIQPCDRDIVAVTESVVARAQGNYATVEQIAKDVRQKTGGGTVGVAFPILSRNRFSILLRGMAAGCDKIVLLLSYPSDEVGNHLVDLELLDKAGINPYHDVLNVTQFRKHFGHILHPPAPPRTRPQHRRWRHRLRSALPRVPLCAPRFAALPCCGARSAFCGKTAQRSCSGWTTS